MRPEERTPGALWDMQRYCRETQQMIAGRSFDEWFVEPTLRFALERVVQIIGEAAAHVDRAFQETHPEIPWSTIIGLRNILVHNYAAVDIDRLWAAATTGVDKLLLDLEPLVPQPPETNVDV